MIRITIKTDNAAFEDREIEIARILHALADRILDRDPPRYVSDINGNRCGSVTVTGKDRG